MSSLFDNAHNFNISSGNYSDVVGDDLSYHNRRYKPVQNYNKFSNVNAGIVYSSSSNYLSKYAERPPWETENMIIGPSDGYTGPSNPWSTTPLGTPRNPYGRRREGDWSDIPYRRLNSQERPFTTLVSSSDPQAWTLNSYNTSLNEYSNVNNDYSVVNITASPLPIPAMRRPSPRPYVSDYPPPSRSPLRLPVTISDESRAVPAPPPVPPTGLNNGSTDKDVPIREFGALGLTFDLAPSSSTPTEEVRKTSQDPPIQASQPVQPQSSEQPPRDPSSEQDPQPQLQEDESVKPPEQLPSEQSSQPRQPEHESVEHPEQQEPRLEHQSTTVSEDSSHKAGSNKTLDSDEEKKDTSSKGSRSTSPKPKKRELLKKFLHLGDKSTT